MAADPSKPRPWLRRTALAAAIAVALSLIIFAIRSAPLPEAPPHGRKVPLLDSLPSFNVVPAHDRDAYEKFFGPEPRCTPEH